MLFKVNQVACLDACCILCWKDDICLLLTYALETQYHGQNNGVSTENSTYPFAYTAIRDRRRPMEQMRIDMSREINGSNKKEYKS